MFVYKTKGVCSQEIHFELDGDTIKSVEFIGGCSGNTQGVARLVEGMKVSEAISRLEGIKCGFRPTSCPDQLTKGLKLALQQQQQ
ncbi:MAG: TIGR03905 family TSCPD domain-containing protein [Candidatus Choladocola sp.]|nr:TIGR03905 family TSCPD domain-containing protein [Candidatus Choladocola sp.]